MSRTLHTHLFSVLLAGITLSAVLFVAAVHGSPTPGVAGLFRRSAKQMRQLHHIARRSNPVLSAAAVARDSSRDFVAQNTVQCQAQLSIELSNLQSSCGSNALDDFDQLMDVTSYGSADHVAADNACAPACRAAWNGMVGRLISCFDTTTSLGRLLRAVGTLHGMCTERNGMSCSRQMKRFGALIGCDDIRTEAVCSANGAFDEAHCWWGQANSSGVGCHPLHTQVAYNGFCPCFDPFMRAFTAASAGSSTQQTAVRLYDLVEASVCLRDDNSYCFPRIETPSVYPLYGVEWSSLPLDSIDTGAAAVCDDGWRCINKIVQTSRAGALATETNGFTECAGRCLTGSGGQSCRRACAHEYVSEVKDTYDIRPDALCGVNPGRNLTDASSSSSSDPTPTPTVASTATRCLRHWHEMHRDPCNASIVGGTCTEACALSFSQKTIAAGCCNRAIERAWRNEVPRELMPAEVAALLPDAPSNEFGGRSYTESQVRANFATCQASNPAWGTTNADAVSATWTQCPSYATRLFRTLRLPSLRWSAVANNRTLRARLTESIKLDIGSASATPSELILGLPEEDGGGIKMRFLLRAETEARAEEMGRLYDTAVASGTFAVPSVAAFVADECSSCVTGDANAVRGNNIAPSSASLLSLLVCTVMTALVILSAA